MALLAVLCAVAGLAADRADIQLTFTGDSAVPPAVQEFARRVVKTRCDYQSYERRERSFWAYDARASQGDGGTVYSINVVSDVTWKKRIPPAFIEMTIVDDGGLRLTSLKSSFITCGP